MRSEPSVGTRRPAPSASALLDAAVALYARHGPDGASLREVAGAAGLTHAMVARHFGDKDGLVRAVGDRVVSDLGAVLGRAPAGAAGYRAVVHHAGTHHDLTRLVVRCGLGDLHPNGFPDCLAPACWRTPPTGRQGSAAANRRAVGRYGAAALVLGWLTFDGFLTPAVGIGRVGRARRDAALADAAAAVDAVAGGAGLVLRPHHPPVVPPTDHEPPAGWSAARPAIVRAAVELFASRGPASVSIRDVARHAGVNHGLVHRHVGSKAQLVAAAIDAATAPLLPGALASSGFDVDIAVTVLHRDPAAARLIARLLIDGIDIRTVRHRFPVMRGLVAAARRSDAGARPPALADPRLAAAAAAALALGSVVWGPWLGGVTGLPAAWEPQTPVADLARWLLGVPPPAPAR